MFLLLGEDELAIGDDVKRAAGAHDQLGVDAERFLERGRQTGGLG